MVISIGLSDAERKLAEEYAVSHSISVEEAFKRALFERIENEYDISMAEEAYKEYDISDKKSRPIEELWKELDL